MKKVLPSLAALLLGAAALANAGCSDLLGFEDFSGAEVDSGTAPDDASVHADATVEAGLPESGPPKAEAGPDGEAGTPDASVDGGVDAAHDASTDAPTCCTVNTTQCITGAAQTCKTQPNGCTQWVTTTTCGAHQTCVKPAGGAAACQCIASVCTQAGKQCDGPSTLATCATDGQCAYVASSATCTAPMTCSGQAPNAACALTCTDSCTKGQTACGTGGVQTCTLGTNGCYSYATTTACVGAQTCSVTGGKASCNCNNDAACLSAQGNTCTATSNSTSYVTCQKDVGGCFKQTGTTTQCAASQVCTGAAGAASCTCKADPICSASGTYCSGSTVVTCSQDAQHCWQHATSATCTNGTCSGTPGTAACCTNQCTTGAAQCSSATTLQTCQMPANACSAWSSQTCATGNVCERHGGASCVDPNWAEWPMPNASPDTPTAPYPESYTDGSDGTVTDNWTSLAWQKMVSGTYTWQEATTYCSTLNLGGHTDWRVPTLIEVVSILDLGFNGPSINQTFFPGTSASTYWSSTPVAGTPTSAWGVWFGSGATERDAMTSSQSVRCVR
jgi:hypothetical protein